MGDWYTNNSGWPEQQKPEPKLVDYKDFDPDKQRSSSLTYIEDRGRDIMWVMAVKGLGVVLMRASGSDSETGRLNFDGVSIFTDAEIGHRK